MQMICALLIFQTPDLPAPLAELSPWLDWLITPHDRVLALLEAQAHRRFIKTHTPLDGLPLDPRATYIVVGRHPLDIAVSLYHQGSNINRDRMRELTGQNKLDEDRQRPSRPPLHDWLVKWIQAQNEPGEDLDSLNGVMWHMSDAWGRRTSPARTDPDARPAAPAGHPVPAGGRPDVLLVHYDDLSADLGGEMRRLAGLLGISVPRGLWPGLVGAATFDEMRARAMARAPDPAGVLKDPAAFFRRGYSGAGREELSSAELRRYSAHAAGLVPPDLHSWLHREKYRGRLLGGTRPGGVIGG
jgi:hypothetical protein